MIRASTLYTVFFLFIFISVNGQNKNEIPWSEDNALTWDKFKKRAGANSLYKAYTYSGIRYKVDQEEEMVTIGVDCYFLKNESWVYKGFTKDYLLNHEQRHFDITEIYARKMRTELAKYVVPIREFMENNMIKDVERIFNDLYDEMERTQKKYDKETNHSMIKDKQAEWNDWIDNQLER